MGTVYAAWSAMAPESRAQLMTELPGRASQLKKRRGGREGRLAADGADD